jgi:hypothetical protein
MGWWCARRGEGGGRGDPRARREIVSRAKRAIVSRAKREPSPSAASITCQSERSEKKGRARREIVSRAKREPSSSAARIHSRATPSAASITCQSERSEKKTRARRGRAKRPEITSRAKRAQNIYKMRHTHSGSRRCFKNSHREMPRDTSRRPSSVLFPFSPGRGRFTDRFRETGVE